MRLRHFITAFLLCIIGVSCIKENRTNCPCYLHLDLSRVDSHYVHTLDLMLDGSSDPVEWIGVDKSYIGDTLIIPVAKSEFDLCVWGNILTSRLEGNSRTIIPGNVQDSLWSDYQRISTHCEDAYVSVVPARQYIPVTIIVRGQLGGITNMDPVLGNISDRLTFTGIATGTAGSSRPFLVSAPKSPEGHYLYRTVILTQPTATAADLTVQFERDGHAHRSVLPIGRMLLEIGEDISLPGRNPVVLDITIGTANLFFTIKVDGWTTHGVYEITF